MIFVFDCRWPLVIEVQFYVGLIVRVVAHEFFV